MKRKLLLAAERLKQKIEGQMKQNTEQNMEQKMKQNIKGNMEQKYTL